MKLNRRDLLAGAGGLAAHAAFGKPGTQPASAPAEAGFPRKADFHIVAGSTYLNNASTHPMPAASMQAYREYVERRGSVGAPADDSLRRREVSPTAAFAALINARPSEVGYVQNTSSGENLVIESLGLDRKFEGNVVTDWLHFEGALVHLMELRKQGLDVRVARPREGRIDIKDLERLVDRNTKLIEVSFVSMYNGFQHDLKAVSDLAHAHGAYVYADIIQGAGAVPLDVRATGVDFASCATYKWLMGDFGLGFFYCREELIGRIRRPHISYPSAAIETHHSPFDPRHDQRMTYTMRSETSAMSQTGTTASGVAEALAVSLPYIRELGVENIQNHRRPLLRKLQEEMPRLGFTPQTPPESASPIVTFAHRDTSQAARKLRDARVSVSVYPYAIRISPSIYNDLADVDRLLDALS
ncbi:MAG: aminotransferase class V-fold PLP-dependent enzyme [Acidobacteria bacterium]|nr:aminotransferase class V-fold PLP-dependent enzyme [Acidobacteriota bacterium]